MQSPGAIQIIVVPCLVFICYYALLLILSRRIRSENRRRGSNR